MAEHIKTCPKHPLAKTFEALRQINVLATNAHRDKVNDRALREIRKLAKEATK